MAGNALLRFAFVLALAAAPAASAQEQATRDAGWSVYRDFTFTGESDAIRDADRTKALEVAQYATRNPHARLGLDGLNRGRVVSVRDALVHAGVPESRIETGAFAEPRLRAVRRVLVVFGR